MSDSSQGEKDSAQHESESEGPKGLTIRTVILTLIFSTIFSVATIYTLVVLSFSMGIVGVVSVILASSASIWGVNATTKNKVKPPAAQELVGASWLSSAFAQSLGTTIVMGGVLLMQYILPYSVFPSWQRWWFAPAQSDLGNIVAWFPTILFWMLIVFLVRVAVIGIGLRLKRRYIETDELPFPVAEGQADVIRELTMPNEPPTPSLRYFLAGIIFALIFSLVVEHNWDYPLLTPLITAATGILLFVGAMNNAFPWRVGRKAPRGLDKVAYYFAYFFIFIAVLGLISCVYAPAGSLFYYLRFGLPHGVDLSYVARFVDLSFLFPQHSVLGFGVSISILLFIIGYLIPADASSGALIGSLTAFVLIPLAFFGLTGPIIDPTTLFNIDFSLALAALLCATIVGSAVIIARTVLSNREGSKIVILRGAKALYTLGEGRKTKTRGKGSQRLGGSVWIQFLLVWVPLTVLALITTLIVGIEPGAPWYLPVIILLFAFAITPLATTLGTWVASRTTRMASQSPLPFLYEAVLFGAGVKELSPYAFGAPVVWQAPGLLSQLRVARLTKTESKVVYWADIIGFPILSVFASFLICIWVFSAVGTPSASLSPPGIGGTALGQWNFAPVWNALYTFVIWLAQGGGAFPYQCDPIIFFLLPLLILAAWTILHGFKRIPIASISGILIGFAVLPYMAITIALGALTAALIKKAKGVEWFARYGITLGAGIYAGASISMFLIVVVAPLIP